MIPTKNLRKGNLIRTEHGELPVHHIVFNDIYVKGKDGRVLYAAEIEGVGIGEIHVINVEKNQLTELLKHWLFVHEMQNYIYWTTGKELELNYEPSSIISSKEVG